VIVVLSHSGRIVLAIFYATTMRSLADHYATTSKKIPFPISSNYVLNMCDYSMNGGLGRWLW